MHATLSVVQTSGSESLVHAHRGLVHDRARKLYRKYKNYLDYDDLVSAGMEGLVIAANRYASSRGVQFSTYATFWIRNRMSILVRQMRWVTTIPDGVYRDVQRLARAEARFYSTYSRPPSTRELSELLQRTEQQITDLAVWLYVDSVSLDAPVSPDEKSTLADFIADTRPDPGNSAGQDSLRGFALQRLLEGLHQRERKILTMYYGLDGDEKKTAEIAAMLGMTPQSVHYVRTYALRKLRTSDKVRRSWIAWRLDLGTF